MGIPNSRRRLNLGKTFSPVGGVNNPREINGNPKLQEAFELGKNV